MTDVVDRPMHVADHAREREHRRRRMRRHGRRAYIRSIHLLPSMATLGNAVCGFAAIYVAFLAASATASRDPWTNWWAQHGFVAAAYLIFLAMIFDALDGRLARFARHTTDFGGQLDSLADVVSFGAAPAFIALALLRVELLSPRSEMPFALSRLIWAIGALYFSCAAIRLARFNVSNEHGEQHHFSFLGLPSPGAGGAVAAWVLMQQDLAQNAAGGDNPFARFLSVTCLVLLPVIVLGTGLLMISAVRYPHVINRYLRGRQPVMKLLAGIAVVLLLVVWHQYALGLGMLAYVIYGVSMWAYGRAHKRHVPPFAP